jgi:type 1 glutamine amidotransferase
MKLIPSLIAAASLAAGAVAAEPKRVVVCTVTTGFRHSSIPVAEKTLQKLADESKAFVIVDMAQQPAAQPKTPEFDAQMKESMAKLSPQYLTEHKIDGVIFANTTGDLPLPDAPGFIKWIEAGHGFMAMHSGSDTLHGFRAYNDMLQGEFNTHGAQVPADLTVADTQHPATKGVPAPWDLKQEEMYQIKNQDGSKVHTLLYLKHHPNNPQQLGFFPVSWCRKSGEGRVFYTSLGHREDLWSDDPAMKGRVNPVETAKQFQQHILGGIKWALGIEDGSSVANNPLP